MRRLISNLQPYMMETNQPLLGVQGGNMVADRNLIKGFNEWRKKRNAGREENQS